MRRIFALCGLLIGVGVVFALTPSPSPTQWARGASIALTPNPSPTKWERGAAIAHTPSPSPTQWARGANSPSPNSLGEGDKGGEGKSVISPTPSETVPTTIETVPSSTETVPSSMETVPSPSETVPSTIETSRSAIATIQSGNATAQPSKSHTLGVVLDYPAGDLAAQLSQLKAQGVQEVVIRLDALPSREAWQSLLETAEVYYCLAGRGMMVLQTQEGDWATEELLPGRLVYVPPCWAHRSVNTGAREDLVTCFAYPAHAGHDYASIEKQGFRKCIVEQEGRPQIIDNPRWLPPEER